MSSSTRIDINFMSLGADGAWVYRAGQPDQEQVSYPENGVFSPLSLLQYASILKLSQANSPILTGLTVTQGYESSVDINNRSSGNLSGTFGIDEAGQGNQILSVKSNSHVTISGILKGSGNRLNADILVDNWSDQSYSGSSIDITNAKHNTGRKIKVVYRIGASTIKGDCQKLFWSSLKMTTYWWLKWIVRKILRIPVGTKGPSWL